MKRPVLAISLLLPCLGLAATRQIDCTQPQWKEIAAINALTLAPGDQLLLKSGCVWKGTLSPKGSGSALQPVVISRYGNGPLPRIDGGGAEAAMLLRNQEFLEVSELELTNDAAGPGLRRGILIRAENLGRALQHIYLRKLDIHNVKGQLGADMVSKATGGIGFEIVTKEKPTRLDDILIENNHVHSVDCMAIYLNTDVGPHPRDPRWNDLKHTRVVLRGNLLEDVGKNAICIRASQAPLIERNTIRNAAARYHGNAIYVFGCKDAVMQYNEVSGTKHLEIEGAAFDSDYNCEGTIIQYNYAHHNGGGLVDFCNNPVSKPPRGFNDGTILRYNVSRDDSDRVIAFDGPVTNTRIYNNSLFIGRGYSPNIVEFDLFGTDPGYADHTEITKNLFEDTGKGQYLYGKATNYTFEGNCFAAQHGKDEPADAKKTTPVAAAGCPADVGAIQPRTFVFAKAGDQELQADLYMPPGPGPFPAAVFLHGGGWSSGDRTQLKRQATYLATLGVVGLAIEYRLSPANKYPLAVYDAKAAVRYLRANAAQYNIDPKRIFAIGSSAGGHLAALLGTTNGDASLEGDICCRGVSSDVTAVVAFNPVLDLSDLEGKDGNTIKFLGGKCAENEANCKAASPLKRVSNRTVPMLLLHGTADQTVPYRQSKAMYEALQGFKIPSRLFTAEGGPHTFWSAAQWYLPWEQEMEEFLRPWLNAH